MATPFLTRDNFKELLSASKEYMDAIRKPYAEFERVKNNRPHPLIDPKYPKTTDGTTASQVRIVPRRAVQQVPYGKAEAKGNPAMSCLADFVLQEEIIPNSTTQDDILGKSWKAIEDQLTYGSADAYVFYKIEGDYFGTDFKMLQKRDLYLEAGKGTFTECNLYFIRLWYSNSDLQAVIDKEESLAKAAKERGEKYKTTWDLPKLKRALKDSKGKEKEEEAKTDAEKEKNLKNLGFEVFLGVQKGKGAKFYAYLDSGDGGIVREWTNPDPRGVPNVERMYFEQDMSNPDGRGMVELVAPLQNFLDSSLQSYQYQRALAYSPPLTKRGTYSRNQIQLVPNAIIDLGNDPNARLDALNLNNSALNNFSQDYSLVKSMILNLFGSDDQTISASAGNPSFSKTDAGVNARQQIVAVNDNFIRKRYESWIGRIWETQLNIYFAVTQGDREFPLSEEWAQKLSKYQTDLYEITENMTLLVHFSSIQDAVIKFSCEASTSKAPDTDEDKDRLVESVKTLAEIGLLQQLDPKKLTERILIKTNVEDPEELFAQDMTASPNVQNLINAGLPPEVAQYADQLEQQGYTPEQIDQILAQKFGGVNAG